ncbi:30846_t:CDS:2 [Gigaspora margarita]|uniref:30846_t:CDS:1 n=1 Tax=Gigaspora margarita TaxID=4874 RepID=A0ABN7UYR6_GIGMA|nr:30846_t:CDS:2 [Gigaspora margarita]
MIMEVLLEHNKMKNWKKLKERDSIEKITLANIYTRKVKKKFKTQELNGLVLKSQCKPISKKRSKQEWVIEDKNKENQSTIGQIMAKKAQFTNIICYESNKEKSPNRVLQEKSSNRVKRTRTEKLIDILPWVKYTKGEINLELEPDYFIDRRERSSISSEQTQKEEEILDSIKEELRHKDEIVLGLDRLKEFLVDNIGSSLEGMNLSKNKAWDIAVAFLNTVNNQKRQETKKKERKRRKPKEKKKRCDNLNKKTEEKEMIVKDRKLKWC